jgi:plasmid maintenance system antidote protein VapI
MSENPAMDKLYELYDIHGSWTNVAQKLGFTLSYISDVINFRRPISAKLANKLGFRKKVEFVEEVK